jgi:hypothetical protein
LPLTLIAIGEVFYFYWYQSRIDPVIRIFLLFSEGRICWSRHIFLFHRFDVWNQRFLH